VPVVVILGVAAVLAAGAYLIWHSEGQTNKVALTSKPKPVTVITAKAKDFQPSRTYVGTLEAWLSANVGPQMVSAYVDTVLVRPGAVVKHGDVLATLDCRGTSAESQSVAMEARAIDARQKALAMESARLKSLVAGQFVSANEAEQKAAQTAAELAKLEAAKSKLTFSSLEVSDCVLRAPFDGEVASRAMDPGAFVRPGMTIVSVVDRSTVRLAADAPEIDFDVVAPGRQVRIHLSATRQDLVGTVARRSPTADPATRSVHFEVDLADPTRGVPVGTTGEAQLDVGAPIAATEIPIYAASVRGKKATLFVVEGGVAKSLAVAVLGESGGSLFVDATLKPGALVVTEGRALLINGDRVTFATEKDAANSARVATPSAETGAVKP
jgi:membrane fusion protein (multidrug efflux system)